MAQKHWFHSLLLCLLATQLSPANSRVIQNPSELCNPSLQLCLNQTTLDAFRVIEVLDVDRRGGVPGGKGGKGKEPEPVPGSSSGGVPPTSPGGTTGTGGFGSGETSGSFQQEQTSGGFDTEETTGGFDQPPPDEEQAKRPQDDSPSPPPAKKPKSDPAPDPVPVPQQASDDEWAALQNKARTNGDKPATDPSKKLPLLGPEIDVEKLTSSLRQEIWDQDLAGGHFYFFSGFNNREAAVNDLRLYASKKIDPEVNLQDPQALKDLQHVLPAMNDIMRYPDGYTPTSQNLNDYFWAAQSRAFAKAVDGTVVFVKPKSMSINWPYFDKGSMWWSYEAPELTRNPYVQEIQLIDVDLGPTKSIAKDDLKESMFSEPRVVWKQNDPLWGTPGDEHDQFVEPEMGFDV